jgi:integrase/recombinase XerD
MGRGLRQSRPGYTRQGVRFAPAATADVVGASGTWARLVPAWLSDLAVRGYAEASRQTWETAMGLFVAWVQERGLTEAGQVTRAVMEAYQRHLFRLRSGRGRGPRGGGGAAGAADSEGHPLAIRTQRSRLHAVDRFYAWAVRRGVVGANPAADLELPRKPKSLPDYLTDAEAASVLATCDTSTPGGLRDRAILELLYSSGLRRMEAMRLLVWHLDLERGVVQVVAGKGNKDRFVPVGRRAVAYLARYLAEVRSRWCRDVTEQRLFLEDDGQPMSVGAFGGRLHRLLAAAGIQKRGACHLFRHAFATALVEGGCDIRLIAAMLGHADLESTMLYTRVGIGQLVAAHRLCHPSEREAHAMSHPAERPDGARPDSAFPGQKSGQNPGEVRP